MGIPFFISALLIPFIGTWIDKNGKRVWIIISASLFIVVAHSIFLLASKDFLVLHPIIPLFFLGLGYTGYAAAIWPSVVYCINDNLNLGLAIGVIMCILNLGLFLIPIIVAWVNNNWGYSAVIFNF